MEVLIVCRNLSGHGGMETIISTMLKGLNQSSGYDAKLFILNFSRHQGGSKNNLWKEGLPVIENYSRAPRFLLHYTYALRFAEYVNKNNIDTVICADEFCVFTASLSRHLVKHPYAIISWTHFSLHTVKPKRRKWFKRADKNIAISNLIATQLVDNGCPRDKVFTLFNCVPKKKFTLSDKRPQDQIDSKKPVRFMYIGRVDFEGQKRLRDMFLGLSKLSYHWELHIIGSGEDEILRNFAIGLGIEANIIWHGWQDNPWQYIKNKIGSVSCSLLTSEFEGMPMALIEAVSYGIPCISSNCQSGPSDIILHGQNGYLYEPLNIDSFVEQLNKFYTDGVALSPSEIQEQAKIFYEEHYFNELKNILNS